MKTPLPYQLEKLAALDKKNVDELAAIQSIEPGAARAAEVARRVHRLKKAVKEAQRFADEIGFVRQAEHHENGDGQ